MTDFKSKLNFMEQSWHPFEPQLTWLASLLVEPCPLMITLTPGLFWDRAILSVLFCRCRKVEKMALRATSFLRSPRVLMRSAAAVNQAFGSRLMSDMAFTFAAPNGVHYKVNWTVNSSDMVKALKLSSLLLSIRTFFIGINTIMGTTDF